MYLLDRVVLFQCFQSTGTDTQRLWLSVNNNLHFCKFTFHVRRDARIECERLFPDKGPLPVIAHTFDILLTSFTRYFYAICLFILPFLT